MDAFFSSLVSGLILGSLYAIMAIGLTVIYGVSHVFNFAHGHIAVLGAYIAWFLAIEVGATLGPGVLVAMVLLVLLGWLLYRLPIRHLLRRKEWGFATLLFTLGLAILLEYTLLEVFGPRVKSIPRFFEGTIRLWFGRVSLHDLALIVISIAIILSINALLNRTTTGQAMRAVAQSVHGARLVGIDIDRIYGYTFAFAFVLTCISGVLLGTKSFMTPHVGWDWMIKGFIIVTFGGLGNVVGAIVAAFTLGSIEAMVTLYAGTIWIWPAWLLTFILALWFRPQGILGGRTA
jgi:branched-chain amino acid transport system permease protein